MEIEFSKDDKRDYVAVPKALLAICLGLLVEADKLAGVTGSNWDDDMQLACAQLRVAIAE